MNQQTNTDSNDWLSEIFENAYIDITNDDGTTSERFDEDRAAKAIQSKVDEMVRLADIKARINEWENIDGDDTYYWDYREIGNTTEKVYLTPIERNDELEAQLSTNKKGGE